MKQSEEKTNLCKICLNPIEEISFQTILFKEVPICSKCFNLFIPTFEKFYFHEHECLSIYDYDQIVQENLFQFKGCFDYELRNVFFAHIYPFLRHKYRGYIIVPAPSFKEANNRRGFNHVIEIFKPIGLDICDCVVKTKNVKQADLNANERKNVSKILEISDIDLTDKKVLICDDVFTTGSTVKSMIDLLSAKHPKEIKVLVMSKTKHDENT